MLPLSIINGPAPEAAGLSNGYGAV